VWLTPGTLLWRWEPELPPHPVTLSSVQFRLLDPRVRRHAAPWPMWCAVTGQILGQIRIGRVLIDPGAFGSCTGRCMCKKAGGFALILTLTDCSLPAWRSPKPTRAEAEHATRGLRAPRPHYGIRANDGVLACDQMRGDNPATMHCNAAND
jgi:hypothetical protein